MPWVSPDELRRQRLNRHDGDLPPGFTSIRDILKETIPVGNMVNVIGIVKDHRLPIPTRGSDYKTTMTLCDLSTQDDGDTIDLNVFRPLEDAPKVDGGDVFFVYQAKVQRFRSNPLSLISSFRTILHIFSAPKILKPPRSAKAALLPHTKKDSARLPKDLECDYVSYMFHEIDKEALPDREQSKALASQSLNVRDKFSLLQDVSSGHFYDLIVRLARDPYDMGDKMTLYVSDYTENSDFFNYTWEGVRDMESGEADPYGYARTESISRKNWAGPYGKKTMQITCYEPHASSIRQGGRAGSWASLQNVQVKFGQNGSYLEGFMREERNSTGTRINAHLLDITDRDSADPRLVGALGRCRDYDKEKKADLKRLKSAEGGLKRKADDAGKATLNSKQRRKQKRAEAEEKANKQESKNLALLGLNNFVTCESSDEPICTVETVIEPPSHNASIDGKPTTLLMPFVCMKYRVNVRVVDFHPRRLEDFACSRRPSDFDILSQASEDDTSDSDEDDDTDGRAAKIWEWRFMLQLEDASAKKDNSFWVVVDNSEAQYLTGLDATNLRHDAENLENLREKLFTLWGNLEERKARTATKEAEARKRKPGDQPLDSSDNEDDAGRAAVSNKPFTCCIRQYGVKVNEEQPLLANAGNGKRWQRVFGLFGTKISG